MRAHFSDTGRLKALAEKNLASGVVKLKRWWSNKYKLPPNHDLFVNQSVPELTLEMYEDLVAQRAEILEELDDEDTPRDEIPKLEERVNTINEVLGYPEHVQDDLVDKWEQELAEGKKPDLNER